MAAGADRRAWMLVVLLAAYGFTPALSISTGVDDPPVYRDFQAAAVGLGVLGALYAPYTDLGA